MVLTKRKLILASTAPVLQYGAEKGELSDQGEKTKRSDKRREKGRVSNDAMAKENLSKRKTQIKQKSDFQSARGTEKQSSSVLVSNLACGNDDDDDDEDGDDTYDILTDSPKQIRRKDGSFSYTI